MENSETQYSAYASYKNNSLFTALPEMADLEGLTSSSNPAETKDVSNALGLHIHEYIHQLHNISTTAGIQLLKNRLVALQIFATGTDDNGHYIRQGQSYKHIDKIALDTIEKDYSRILGNIDKINQEGFLTDFTFETFESQEDSDDPSDPYNLLGIDINYKLAGNPQSKKIENIGYNIITEGIAYEIEMHVRNTITGENGKALEYATPPLPYRFYRPIIEHLVGRPCSLVELIEVGTLALQNKIPSWGLKAATLAMKNGRSIFDAFASQMAEENRNVLSGYKDTVNLLLTDAFKGSAVNEGLKMLDRIVADTIKKREENPFLEILFTQEIKTPEDFLRIVYSEDLPTRCIIQKKPDNNAQLIWIGKNIDELSETTIGAMSTLQCAIQYSQLHLTKSASFSNTSKLAYSPHDLSCPYLDVCPLKSERDNPDLCSTAPWMHDLGNERKEVCWYVNGVKSLRNPNFRQYDQAYD